MHEKGFTEGYNPIVVVSIDILMKYGICFRKFGFKGILDNFINASCKWNSDHSQWTMSPLANFNQFMSHYPIPQVVSKSIQDSL